MKYSTAKLLKLYKKLLYSLKVFQGKFLFVCVFFVIAFLMGFFTAKVNPLWTEEVIKILAESFADLAQKDSAELWIHIFFNNLSISAVLVIFFFLFGLAPVSAILSNGIMIGVVTAYSIEKLGIAKVFLALAPHGILELPAFFLAAALSLHLSGRLLAYLRKKSAGFKPELLFAAKIFFFIITPLLFIAALIETFLTPLLIV